MSMSLFYDLYALVKIVKLPLTTCCFWLKIRNTKAETEIPN